MDRTLSVDFWPGEYEPRRIDRSGVTLEAWATAERAQRASMTRHGITEQELRDLLATRMAPERGRNAA